jgi:hypothetical protein
VELQNINVLPRYYMLQIQCEDDRSRAAAAAAKAAEVEQRQVGVFLHSAFCNFAMF